MSVELAPTVGYASGSDASDGALSIGADARLGVGALPIAINPTFDYFFVDGATQYEITANAIYEFDLGDAQPIVPYVGAGLSYFSLSIDNDLVDIDLSETGLNTLGGAKFEAGGFRPFVQVNYSTAADGTFSGTGGLLFGF